jgi:hypothetical protein
MNNILEQVGITKEELIERIINKALGITADYKQTGEETWEEIPFSSVVDKKITDTIKNMMNTIKPMIEERVIKIMDQEMEKVFNSPFQRVDSWGKAIGEPVSIRDIIAEQSKKYWETTVDSTGKPSNSYNSSFPRSEYYARQVMTDYYNKELVNEVKKMADDLSTKIPDTIGDEIHKTVLKYLRRK